MSENVMRILLSLLLHLALGSSAPQPWNSDDRWLSGASDQLLKAFGMKEPGYRGKHTEPPQYMLDLYNRVANSDDDGGFHKPYGATIVRAFSEKDPEEDPSLFSFKISGLQEDETILEVEFHLYHSHLADRRLLSDRRHTYRMEVFSISDAGITKLASRHVTSRASGWRIFHLGQEVIRSVLHQGSPRVTLMVSAVTEEGHHLPINLYHSKRQNRQPLLILFDKTLTNHTRDSTDVLHSRMHSGRVRRSSEPHRIEWSIREEDSEAPSGCELRNMTVDFEEIGWSSWIIFPRDFDAFKCVGKCMFPLGQEENPTNHATILSIIKFQGGDAPQPCCVPDTYKQLELLYYDAEENVVLKHYDQMVALSCGCH